MNKKLLTIKTVTFTTLILLSTLVKAVPVTFSVGEDASSDVIHDVNLDSLLPLSTNNSWSYILTQGSLPVSQRTASLGSPENIGGGCLRVEPLTFGRELSLYIAHNPNGTISLYGMNLAQWKGERDLSIKFETRKRKEYRNFRNFFISGDPDERSCQDTERGRSERGGLVLFEDLSENLGIPGDELGEIDCRGKNSDLRETFTTGRNGSGTATVGSSPKALAWSVIDYSQTLNSDDSVSIRFQFKPTLQASPVDYSMFFDMRLEKGFGITDLALTGEAFGVVSESYDLSYTLERDSGLTQISDNTNQVVARGSCPEEGKSSPIWLFILFTLVGLIFIRTINIKAILDR